MRAVVNILKQEGIDSVSSAEYLSFRQRENERENGIKNFQRVEVRVDGAAVTKLVADTSADTKAEEAPHNSHVTPATPPPE